MGAIYILSLEKGVQLCDVVEGSLSLSDFLLRHDTLAWQAERNWLQLGNRHLFLHDLAAGHLAPYAGTWVVYHAGVWCGQGGTSQIFEEATKYYGSSKLAAFKVPAASGYVVNSMEGFGNID